MCERITIFEKNPPVRNGRLQFLDLPAELRVQIYRYLLPHGMEIKFAIVDNGAFEGSVGYAHTIWKVLARQEKSASRFTLLEKSTSGLSLLLINKLISREARAIIYGENTFQLDVDTRPHYPTSLSSPLIFGPLGLECRLPLIRNLRSIKVNVEIGHNAEGSPDHWLMERLRSRLEYLVKILKQYADDDNQKSLLDSLHIVYQHTKHPQSKESNYLFGLETLADLRGIKDVRVTGVPPWFGQCLELCIKGRGGEVKHVDYPEVIVKKRKRGQTKWQKNLTTTRKWQNPILDWKVFAERNEIELTPGIDCFHTDS